MNAPVPAAIASAPPLRSLAWEAHEGVAVRSTAPSPEMGIGLLSVLPSLPLLSLYTSPSFWCLVSFTAVFHWVASVCVGASLRALCSLSLSGPGAGAAVRAARCFRGGGGAARSGPE